MSKSFQNAAAQARKKAVERCRHTLSMLSKPFGKWKFPEGERVKLDALLGIEGRAASLPASDLSGLLQAGDVFLRLCDELMEQHPARNYFFATIIDDLGNTLDRAPILRFKAYQEKMLRVVRKLGLSGVMVNGVHPFVNHPGGADGRQLSVDAHFLLWSDKPFNAKAAQKALNHSGVCTSSLTHKPVEIKPLDRVRLPQLCYYLFKPWHEAKNRVPRKNKPGRFRLLGTRAAYRPELAMRVFEGLSQIRLMDLVVGINGGKTLRQAFRAEMTRWYRGRTEPVVVQDGTDVWQTWATLRKENGSPNYMPYRHDLLTTPSFQSARRRPARGGRSRNGPPRRKTRPLGINAPSRRRQRPADE